MVVSPASDDHEIADSTASGGHALELYQNATASTNLSLPASIGVVIRAKGQNCWGAPTMTVSIDGQAIATTTVTATSWTNYPTSTTIPAGTHTLSIALTDALNLLFCRRTLFLDDVSFTPAVATGITGTGPTGGFGPATAGKTTWSMAFEDEFNGTSLDTTKWVPFWYPATQGVDGLSTPAQNVSVSGGNLVLTRSDSRNGAMVSTRPGAAGAPYVGFALGTESVFEARILFPGNGTQIYNWPAFWVLHDEGEPNPPTVEIDVFDMWQPHPQSAYLVNYPTYGNGGPGCNLAQPYTDKYYGDQFHVWTVHRGPSYIDVYIDGVPRWHQAVNSDDPRYAPNSAQYIQINLGTSSQGGPSITGTASNVLVDFVRAWTPQ
jgi:Ca-dependent carbohydrate-binding module xylan-binding